MARYLVEYCAFDHYIAVAPEGHVYGFFFEQFGVRLLSVEVDYPPTQVKSPDDLSVLCGRRLLLVEDDVVSGLSLRLVINEIARHGPSSVSLYLGREKISQQLQNIPSEIERIYLAEHDLDPAHRSRFESELVDMFKDFSR